MSYEGNDLGYDSGYDLETRAPAKSTQQRFSQDPNLPTGYCIKAEGVGAVASEPKYIPSDYSKGGSSGKVRAMKDGQVKEYDSEDAANKDGASKITSELLGQQNGKFLVQYFDSDHKPIKYDQVDRATAEKLGFKAEQLDKAPKIQSGSDSATKLKTLEGSKDENKGTVDLAPGAPVMYAGEAKAANANAKWEPGGSYHDRLSTDYGYSKTDIEFIKGQYGNMDSKDLDAKFGKDGTFRPLTSEEKADRKLAIKQTDASRQAVINDKIDADANKLMDKVNVDASGKKLGPNDAAYLNKDKALLITRQYYRDSGFDPDKTPPNFNKFSSTEVQGGVSKKIGDKGTGGLAAVEGVNGDTEKATRAEKAALTQEVADLMPDKITKKVNGQDKEVKLSKEDKYMYAQLYVQEKGFKTAEDFKKERERIKTQGTDASKKDFKQYAESFHADQAGETRFGDLKKQVGKNETDPNLDKKEKAKMEEQTNQQIKSAAGQEKVKFEAECKRHGIDPNDPDAPAKLREAVKTYDAEKQGAAAKANADAQQAAELEKWGIDPKDPKALEKLAQKKQDIQTAAQIKTGAIDTLKQLGLNQVQFIQQLAMEQFRSGIATLQKVQEQSAEGPREGLRWAFSKMGSAGPAGR